MTPLDPWGRSGLDDLVREIERILQTIAINDDTTDAPYLTLLDRQEQWLHYGVMVFAPDTSNTGRTDQRDSRTEEDVLSIVLKVHIARKAGQREGMARAHAHERLIIDTLESAAELRVYRPEFQGSSRRPGADKAWYEIDIRISFERIAERG